MKFWTLLGLFLGVVRSKISSMFLLFFFPSKERRLSLSWKFCAQSNVFYWREMMQTLKKSQGKTYSTVSPSIIWCSVIVCVLHVKHMFLDLELRDCVQRHLFTKMMFRGICWLQHSHWINLRGTMWSSDFSHPSLLWI